MIRSAFLCALVLSACSLSRAPITVRSTDAGTPPVDAPIPPGLDAPMVGTDAPAPPDAPTSPDAPILPIDAPLPRDARACVPGCAGTVLTTCTAAPVDCAASGMICVDPPTGPPTCQPMPCADGTTCSADGRASLTCAAGVSTPRYCDGYGCDDASGLCDATCNVTGEYVPGTVRFDVCAYGADFVNATVSGACNAAADGEDRMARLVVTRRSHLDARVRDDDSAADVDVVLYLWSVCDDDTTQIACDDDVACAEAADMTGCLDGNQWREAHITADLEPGTYYLVADSIDDWARGINWTCGFVSLTVSLTPL